MASLNRVELIGNLGQDPEIKHTQDGRIFATLSIATSETWRDKASGERKEKTEWHRVVVFSEGLAKVVEEYVRKGDKLYISGKMVTRKWQDKDGQDRYSTEVVLQGFDAKLIMLSVKRDGGSRGEERGHESGASGSPQRRPAPAGAGGRDHFDDEIPF